MMTKQEADILISKANEYFHLSAKAWEKGNNSGNPELAAHYEKKEKHFAEMGELVLKEKFPGLEIFWPGLYPCFRINGYEEHTVESAVLAAAGLPRNYLQ